MEGIFNLVIRLTQSAQNSSGQPPSQCEGKINSSLYLYLLIPSTAICVVFAFTRRRKRLFPDVMGGRPGILIPMDAMTRVSRVSYACAFAAMSSVIYDIVFRGEKLIDYDDTLPFVGPLVKMLCVVIYGVDFYPLLACLAIGSVFGYVVGTLYAWMLTALVIVQLTECPELPTEARVILIFSQLPLVLCLGYLSVSIPSRIPRAMREGRYFMAKTREPDSSVDDIRRAYVGRHVTKLLKKPEIASTGTTSSRGLLRSARSFSLRTLHKWRYRWRHGFRYPTRLLSVMFVSMVIVYATTVAWFAFLIHANNVIEKYEACTVQEDNPICPDQTTKDKSITSFRIFRTSFIISMLVAFVMSLVNVLHMITSFRKNLHALTRGDHSDIPHHYAFPSSTLCVGSMKYAGYQVAYILAGFAVQGVLVFLLIFIFAFLVEVYPSLLLKSLKHLVPWLVMLVVVVVGQRLLAIFVFLQDRAAHLALDNRECFFVFTYFMFFFNIFAGLASSLLRIAKSLFFGTLILSRLDYSVLPRKFERFDPGHKAYLGYLQMEYAHTHPVLLVFTRLLVLYSRSKSMPTVGDDFVDLTTVASAERRGSSRAVRKWHVAYTLIRNPDLLYRRKVYNQTQTSRALAARGALQADIESSQGVAF